MVSLDVTGRGSGRLKWQWNCTDRTLWDILCEMSAIGHCGTSCVKCLHHIKYRSVIFCCCYFCWVNCDKCLQRKESREMYQTSAEWTELLLRGRWRGNVCVCVCLFVTLYKVTNLYWVTKVMQCIRHQQSEQNCYWEGGEGGMFVFVTLY